MKKLLLLTIAIIALSGCETIGHQKYYSQVAPKKYPPTENVMIFTYENVELKEIYEMLFSDYLIIGKSGFNGPYENPDQSENYAKSIGADVFITSSQFKETRTSFYNSTIPTKTTTYIDGYSGRDSFYGTATTYGTETTTIPIQVNRYTQDGIYLKNVNNINPLWERTKDQYKQTADNELNGIWKNENYQIEIFQSGNQMVGFINAASRDRQLWSKGQLKMIFGNESGVGVYLMGEKSPTPSNFSMNKFGHLEVKLLTTSETFSFAKSN